MIWRWKVPRHNLSGNSPQRRDSQNDNMGDMLELILCSTVGKELQVPSGQWVLQMQWALNMSREDNAHFLGGVVWLTFGGTSSCLLISSVYLTPGRLDTCEETKTCVLYMWFWVSSHGTKYMKVLFTWNHIHVNLLNDNLILSTCSWYF